MQGQLADAKRLYKQAATAAQSNLESSKGGSAVLEVTCWGQSSLRIDPRR